MLKLQPYRQTSVNKRASQKLTKCYFGPFEVVRRIGSVAHELLLPPSSRIHPVFHVSQLWIFHGKDLVSTSAPLPENLLPNTTLLEQEDEDDFSSKEERVDTQNNDKMGDDAVWGERRSIKRDSEV